MIEFSLWTALLAGFVGTVVMSGMMRLAGETGMTEMPPMNLIQGAMFTDDEATAKRIGMATHVLLMGTVVFGLVYAGLFTALGSVAWFTGLLIGLVHGVVAGLVMMMMGQAHPRMAPVTSGAGPVSHTPEGLRIESPGPFARNYGSMTPVGLLAGHGLYGLVVAVVYGAVI